MTEQIELGGQMRPVRFGMAAMLEYEQQTGRKVLADFAMWSGGIENVSIETMIDLLYYALTCGHRKQGVNVDFDKFDVADWIMESPDAYTVAMEKFTLAFRRIAGNEGEGNGQQGLPKKRATPTK